MRPNVYWSPLLRSLAGFGHQFIIAGGCVRDQLLGLTAKDIDLCIPALSSTALAELAEGIAALDGWTAEYTPMAPGDSKEYGELEAGLLIGLIRATWTHNEVTFPVDIISRSGFDKGPEVGVTRFDWGILQCWYDEASGTIMQTEIALNDYESRTATLTQRTALLVDRSLERFYRFDTRHPGALTPYWGDEFGVAGEIITLADFSAAGARLAGSDEDVSARADTSFDFD